MVRNSLIIARKELKSYFDLPLAYVFLVVFLVLSTFFFFRTAFLNEEASLRPLFELLPWIFLLFIPAITMRALAAEQKDGTIEVLLAQPIREHEVLIGKFLGNLAFAFIALAITLPLAASLSLGGKPDYGVVAAQYIGAFFLAAGLVSVGIFASALTRSQTVSFIVALAVTFGLTIAGLELIVAGMPAPLDQVFQHISVLDHFRNITRGVVDLRDVVYFLSLVAAFLSLSYLFFLRRKVNRKSAGYRSLQVGTALIVGIAILVNLFGGYIGGRLDFTSEGRYSLSPATRGMLGDLKDVVTLTLYASSQLPAQPALIYRDVRDMLGDYGSAGGGNVNVGYKYPDTDPQARIEAQDQGVPTVQFNVLKEDEFQLKQGYLGLVIRYADQTEIIPFIQSTDDLEYQLTSFIRKMTAGETRKVAFLTGHGEKALAQDLATLNQELSKQYTVEELDLKSKGKVPQDVGVLVVAGPNQKVPDKEAEAIKQYIDGGGKVLLALDPVAISPQTLTASPVQDSFVEFAEKYGVGVGKDLLYDLRSNESVSFGGGIVPFVAPYPFWMRALPASPDQRILSDLKSVLLAWASPVNVDKTVAKRAEPLLATTQFSGAQSGSFNISPEALNTLSAQGLKSRLVAVAVTGLGSRKGEFGKTKEGEGRLVVVGDSDFMTDQFARNSRENLIFSMNAVDWLAQDEALIGIRSKNTAPPRLAFESDTTKNVVRYGNMVGLAVLVALFGALRLARRRRLATGAYAG